MLEQTQQSKRQRGVILSASGWQRLQAAKHQSEIQGNFAQPYTLEKLTELTGLSNNTVTKVQHRQVAVDQQTLAAYFRAFGLTLESTDYVKPNFKPDYNSTAQQQVHLTGPVPLGSPFYVERPRIESLCNETIMQPGALIRIKAPRQMGKTSLMIRILNQARERGLQTITLNMRLADAAIFSNLDRFLYWCCTIITHSLGLPNRLKEYWDDLCGSNYNCTNYFENYLLAEINSPLVLALDDVDVVFNYPEIATDFFGLLQVCYEKSKYGDDSSNVWQKLRLVLVHSTEVYMPLSINQSPFNVGLSVELPEFTSKQVQNLAQRHGLDWSNEQVNQLVALVGRNPHLVQLVLYHIGRSDITLKQLVQTGIASDRIYSDDLRRQLGSLKQHPDLMTAFAQVIASPTSLELEPAQTFKLQSMAAV